MAARGTPRRRGLGTFGRWRRELETCAVQQVESALLELEWSSTHAQQGTPRTPRPLTWSAPGGSRWPALLGPLPERPHLRRTSGQMHLAERQLPAHFVLDRESAHGDLSAGRPGVAGDGDRPAATLDMLAHPPGPAQVARVIGRGRVQLRPGRIANVNRTVGVGGSLNAERYRLTSLDR